MDFEQFIRTNKFGLIKEGKIHKEILLDIKCIDIRLTCPWIKAIVSGYHLKIHHDDKEYSSRYIDNNNLVNDEIQKALFKLKKGGKVEFSIIHTRLPWDDGKRPQNMLFICI